MENEDPSRSFWFIVTGQYLAINYNGNDFEIRRAHHGSGSIFYLSDDEEQIIHQNTYIGTLSTHPNYEDDVFYISKDTQYLTKDAKWTDNIEEAVEVQIEPVEDYGDAEVPLPPEISNPIIDENNPISANGIDLYLPDKWFSLYAITGDSLWLGDASEFEDKLCFTGNPYNFGMPFQLSKHEGKTRILCGNNKYLTVMMEDEVAEYLDEACKRHTRSTRCSRCMICWSVGFSSEPDECFSLVPKGLPSMFALYDGLCYYRFSVLKGSYAELERVESIDSATQFQFVG
ncbi:hypothetical protein N7478_002059 [Penicillium angulare]|uniref:uncharacterized protein n=1 Tax=Penicillium angulare TaxID=116970 RepID=UPI0025406DCC|nr:uncharacterized protein N7478_002059 [Penicillium angulare]KAJ5289029.1 hypothetical protein N7478_002059 [Penicillium angulare]